MVSSPYESTREPYHRLMAQFGSDSDHHTTVPVDETNLKDVTEFDKIWYFLTHPIQMSSISQYQERHVYRFHTV